MLRSFILTGDSDVGVAVGLQFNAKIDGTTADLAILYVVLLRNRGIDQYADALAAIGTFNVPFTELSHSHLAPVTIVSRGAAKAPRTNPKPAGNNRGRKGRVTNGEYPRGGPVIQDSFQPMRYERTGVHCRTRAFTQRHFPACERADYADPGLQHDDTNGGQMCEPKPWVSYPCPTKGLADKNKRQSKHDERNEKNVRQKKTVSGKKKQEVGRHVCYPKLKPVHNEYLARALQPQGRQ